MTLQESAEQPRGLLQRHEYAPRERRAHGEPGGAKQRRVAPHRAGFDPDREQIIGDPEANAMLTRKYREPYVLPDKV